jgi:hypothetical protein
LALAGFFFGFAFGFGFVLAFAIRLSLVIPAKAGIQRAEARIFRIVQAFGLLDPRLRGDDENVTFLPFEYKPRLL